MREPASWPYVAKGLRQVAYGTATVAIPVWLLRQGFSATFVGALVALALFSGAAQSWLSGRLSRSFSIRTITVAASIAMAAGALLILTHNAVLLLFAALLGGMNIGGQEVGPFTAIEQFTLQRTSHDTRRFAWYNGVGTLGMAAGTMIGGIAPVAIAVLVYAMAAALLGILYGVVAPHGPAGEPQAKKRRRTLGIAERFAALFAVDAFGGGFIAQGFMVYWLTWQYHPNIHVLSAVLASSNVLATLSLFAAVPLAARFGLLNTMVFTHLPSNVLLALIPFAPSFGIAAALLLMRSALSQMDVPTRQSLVLRAVDENDRIYAAGITNAVRPAAAALAPTLSGIAAQSALVGAPFFIAGAIKACYDIALYVSFRRIVR